MRYRIITICHALFFLLLFSCAEDDMAGHKREFVIEVMGRVPFCTLTIIEFQNEDLPYLERITGRTGELRYQTNELVHLGGGNQEERKLTVSIRKTMPEETPICNTLGPAFPFPLVTTLEVVGQH